MAARLPELELIHREPLRPGVVTLPEPSSLVLAAFGVLVLVACRWRIA